MDKGDLPTGLVTPRAIVRLAVTDDLTQIGGWLPYPRAYAWANMVPSQRPDRELWWRRIDWPDRAHYSVLDRITQEVIGVYAFAKIDWVVPEVGNMGIRIRPDWCDRRLGRETLAPLLGAMLGAGFKRIRLDVAAPNARAVRCYENCGMKKSEEFWRKGEVPASPDDPNWASLGPHLRRDDDKWMVRFYWMEATPAGCR